MMLQADLLEDMIRRHPAVSEACVIVDPWSGIEPVVIFVPREDPESAGRHTVNQQWRRVFDLSYAAGADGTEFPGWNSRYTGQPLPIDDMREWLSWTLHNILVDEPVSVLEIGCGVGHLAMPLLKAGVRYCGIDISTRAVAELRSQVEREGYSAQLIAADAREGLALLSPGFDIAILNSVAQYLSGPQEFVDVLRAAARLVRAGGSLYIGDLLNFDLHELFHTSLALGTAEPGTLAARLRTAAAVSACRERELWLSPQALQELPLGRAHQAHPALKRGRRPNEIVQFRFDVRIRLDADAAPPPQMTVDWPELGGANTLQRLLEGDSQDTILVRQIPDARLVAHRSRWAALQRAPPDTPWCALDMEAPGPCETVHPEDLYDLAEKYGYRAHAFPAPPPHVGLFEAVFSRRQAPRDWAPQTATGSPPMAVLATHPAHAELISSLHQRVVEDLGADLGHLRIVPVSQPLFTQLAGAR